MESVTLGYWKIRGLAQPIRHLLAYTQIPFNEVLYEIPSKWFQEDKQSLGFDFPNLPYLIDGSFKLTQSSAIAKYVIEKSGKTQLLGKTTLDQAKVDSLIGVFTDAFKQIKSLIRNVNYQAEKQKALESARNKLNYIKDFIGQKQYALGYLTRFDFILAESLYYFEALYPEEKQNYKFWWRIRFNLNNLPQIKTYYQRQNSVSYPFVPAQAALQIAPINKVKLGYWKVRGKAHVARYLLSFFNVQFEEIHYGIDRQWHQADKLTLGLDFPNLPYLIDGEINLTESLSIYKYIINKWGNKEFLGKNIQDNAKIESFISIFDEISNEVNSMLFGQGWEEKRPNILTKISPSLDKINKFIGEKQTVFGYLTLADFLVAQQSHYIEAFYPKEYQQWPFLKRVRQFFENRPQIIAYYKKPTAFNGPYNSSHANLQVKI